MNARWFFFSLFVRILGVQPRHLGTFVVPIGVTFTLWQDDAIGAPPANQLCDGRVANLPGGRCDGLDSFAATRPHESNARPADVDGGPAVECIPLDACGHSRFLCGW